MSSLYIKVIFKTIILEEEASLLAQLVKNLPAVQETWDQSLGWEDPLRRELPPTPVFWPGVTQSRTQMSDFHFHILGERLNKGT